MAPQPGVAENAVKALIVEIAAKTVTDEDGGLLPLITQLTAIVTLVLLCAHTEGKLVRHYFKVNTQVPTCETLVGVMAKTLLCPTTV